MKYHHGDVMFCGSIALLLASPWAPWLRPSSQDPDEHSDTAELDLLARQHQTCEEAKCPCGFKLNLAQVDAECQGPKCDWRDRDTCCIGDFLSGDYPPCYGSPLLDIPQFIDEALVVATRRPQGWPELPNAQGIPTPITSPMMREMAMDAYRGCTEAFACEEAGECRSCVAKHCKGLNSTTRRPKAAPWYPKALSKAPEMLVFQYTCDACFLTDANGRGDGRQGCGGVNDWLASCEGDTPNWRSNQGKTCMDYQWQLSTQHFRNDSLRLDLKANCCKTWTCSVQRNCPTTTTTTTTLPLVDLSLCPEHDGCHETRLCPCHMFAGHIMGYDPWSSGSEERTVRANCCESAKLYERVLAETRARQSRSSQVSSVQVANASV